MLWGNYLCLRFGWNLLSLKGSKTLSKILEIAGIDAGVDDDYWHSWLGLVSSMAFWIVSKCSEEDMFKIWLKSVEFEGIKNPFKDWWHCWRFCWSWWWLFTFLTGSGVLDDVLNGIYMWLFSKRQKLKKWSAFLPSIYDSILDALNLNRLQPNFKYSFLRAYWDVPKHHQGH